jgi:tetratricopeptide (TPR) repeat protein
MAYLYRMAVEKNICSTFVLRFALGCAVLALMLTTVCQGFTARGAPDMFRQTLKYNPHNSRILYSMGLEMVGQKNYGAAERYFRRTLQSDPLHAAARHALGRALHDQGKYIQALAVYQSVKDTGRADALLERNLQAVYPLAIDAYARWLADEPGNARLHYSLGTVYSRAGDAAKGVEQYLQAVALMPDLKDALFNLATTYEALGQADLAVTFYERMLALGGQKDHLDAHAYTHLAELYRARGDEPKAEAYTRQAQEAGRQ